MKIPHNPHHWIAVALVLAALLLTLSEAHGQSTGSAAVFEGRPAMAGPQAGLGAQAGPPQGGLGVQGSDGAQRTLERRPPQGPRSSLEAPPAVPGASSVDVPQAARDVDPQLRKEVKPPRDQSIAKDQRSASKGAKRAVKRSISRGRHGVSDIDSGAAVPAR